MLCILEISQFIALRIAFLKNPFLPQMCTGRHRVCRRKISYFGESEDEDEKNGFDVAGTAQIDSGHRYSFWVQGDENIMSNGDWKKYGTPMKTWIDMGASMDVWLCLAQKRLDYANWRQNHTDIIFIDHPFSGKMYRTTFEYLDICR